MVADKNNILLILLISLLCSCKSLKSSSGNTVILFNSVYDDDLCNLKINDKVYYINEPIFTDRSLGIDVKKEILVSSDTLKLNLSFSGIVDKELNAKRTIKLDTVLYSINGKNILIRARGKNIVIEQQSTPFVLD